MKRLGKFYQVSEGAGLASGRIGMAVAARAPEIEAEPGRYKPFDRRRETVLVDQAGLFSMFDQYLEPVAPPYAFFMKTRMGSSWFCLGVSNVNPEPPDFWTADHAMAAYGFLLPVNRIFSPADFAEIIRRHCSMENPQNRAVVNCLESL